jgi:hypothetical protein
MRDRCASGKRLTLTVNAPSVKAQSPTMAKTSRDNCAIFAPIRETLWELLQPIVTAFPDIQLQVEDVVSSARNVRAELVARHQWHPVKDRWWGDR